MPKFSDKSKSRLITCDIRLQLVMTRVIEHVDCTVLCGHRGEEEQEKAFNEGKSKAHFGESLHNSLPSMAVDVAPYPVDWNDINRFHYLAGFVAAMAAEESDYTWTIEWGGHFKSFFDGPHFQIKELS